MTPNEREALADRRPPEGGRRRDDRRRLTAKGRWLAVGVAVAVVVGIITIGSITQTEWGRDQVLRYTLSNVGGRLNGQLTAERLEGNLIGGARLYDIALRGPDGLPLALIDSAFIRYRVATFLGGDVVITRLEIYNGEVTITRMPGDTLWNYEVILQDPTPDPAEQGSATLIEQLFAYDTRVTISAPLEPDPRFSPERQQQQLEEVLADTVRNAIQAVPGGYLQTNVIDIEAAEVAELYIGSEERGGIYAEVIDGRADVRLWREPPLQVEGLTANIHLNAGLLNYEAPRVVLPNSQVESVGQIDLRGEVPLYDVVIFSPEFALSDLRWLYPWLPEDPEVAGGSVRLWVEDREDGLLVVARELDLRLPDTHVTGSFGLITDPQTDGLKFVDVDLEADPLRVESVELLLPQDLPVEGLVIGGATIRGKS